MSDVCEVLFNVLESQTHSFLGQEPKTQTPCCDQSQLQPHHSSPDMMQKNNRPVKTSKTVDCVVHLVYLHHTSEVEPEFKHLHVVKLQMNRPTHLSPVLHLPLFIGCWQTSHTCITATLWIKLLLQT